VGTRGNTVQNQNKPPSPQSKPLGQPQGIAPTQKHHKIIQLST